jgi:hypothetical protein
MWGAGNPLDRAVIQRYDGGLVDGEVCLVVVSGRELCIRPLPAEQQGEESLELQVLLLQATDPQLELNTDQPLFLWSEGECASGPRERCRRDS